MAISKIFLIRLLFVLFGIWLIFLTLNWYNETHFAHLSHNGQRSRRSSFYIRQNGKYWILYNYILARREYYGNESITYTTHGEYSYLDNLETLIKRWHAPISIVIYACGTDFEETLNSIRYLRSCSAASKLIQDMVTFHIFFYEEHMPSYIPRKKEDILQYIDCSQPASFDKVKIEKLTTYRAKNQLMYPINIARNIARSEATTYYVLPSDIELFPSPNFVEEFLEMVGQLKLAKQRSVFVLPIFEMSASFELPSSKTELQLMLKHNIAIPFHASFALKFHAIPYLQEWIAKKEPRSMEIFKVVTRKNDFWEPFYVTINKEEPYFHEGLTWEGQYDKVIQADLLSIMNYDFILLDKAFLMHRPGIKIRHEPDKRRAVLRRKTENKVHYLYHLQLLRLYGGTKLDAMQENLEEEGEIAMRELEKEMKVQREPGEKPLPVPLVNSKEEKTADEQISAADKDRELHEQFGEKPLL